MVTDTKLLNQLFDESGIKRGKIAESIGITREALWLKLNNKNEFKASEINALCDLLNINSLRVKERVFFAK